MSAGGGTGGGGGFAGGGLGGSATATGGGCTTGGTTGGFGSVGLIGGCLGPVPTPTCVLEGADEALAMTEAPLALPTTAGVLAAVVADEEGSAVAELVGTPPAAASLLFLIVYPANRIPTRASPAKTSPKTRVVLEPFAAPPVLCHALPVLCIWGCA